MPEPAPLQPEAVQPEMEPVDRGPGWFSWLVLFLVATAALSLAAVYLPARVKMLGLFAIGHGLVAGGIAARLASIFELSSASRGATSGVVFLVIVAGQIGMAVESHRLYRAEEERGVAANPKRLAVLRMLQSVKTPDDPKTKQMAADVRKTLGVRGTSFADYLQFRVSEIGVHSHRLAEAIWILEIGLGSLAGTWIFRRLAPAPRLEAPGPPAKLEA
ncbi:MAG TPA: hypothetical protein VHX68_05845 [Planctomycetaceae bacterium]|nr:hypothetical protein [Planctomycetaceae bacterium]